MADNFTANAGAGGDTFGADDVGGIKYPRSKIGFGVDGVYVDASAVNPLPVSNSFIDGGGVPVAVSVIDMFPVTLSSTDPAVSTINLTNARLGGVADAAASADTGSWSVNALIKRGLANWTTLLARVPALVSGRMPVDGSGVTQPISGTVTANTGLAQPLTDTQLRAAAVPVSGAFFQATQPVSVASQPLPTGASTETTLAALNTKIPSVGQALMAASQPVVIASNQSAISVNTGLSQPLTDAQIRATALPVSGTFFQATQPISATALPLPTGAATETTLAALNTKTPALGVAAPTAASPVVLANSVIVGAAASIAALNTDLLTGTVSGWFDATNYRSVSVQIVGSAGITAGAITFEQTNDTTAAAAGNLWPIDEMATATPTPIIAAVTIAASTTRSFGAPVTHRFVRVRVSTAFATANVQAIANFSQATYWRQTLTVHQASAANLQTTVSGTITATVGTSTTGGVISPLTVAGVSVEASTAKTVTATGTTITNNSANGLMLFVNVSVVSGTSPTLAVRLQVQDPVSALWVDVPGAATASITTVSTTLLTVATGVTPVANVAVNYPVPRVYRVAWTIGGTTPSFTFSVGAQYII
jgi:hypothetical protein